MAQPLLDGFRSERRKQRTEDTAIFQRAQRGDVELGNPAGESEDPVALADAEAAQHIGEAIGEPLQIAVAKIARLPLFAEPAQSEMIAPGTFRVTVNAFIGDVQPPTRRT